MIGILALQGAFVEHEACLDKLGQEYSEIRKREHLEQKFDAIVIPGGESTVMGKLLRDMGMESILRDTILGGTPVFGTCAGLIVLSKDVVGGRTSLGTLDVRIVRNAYGRQLGSFDAVSRFAGRDVPMTFIRAPYVESTGPGVQVLSEVDGKVAAVRQGNQLATAFHPELTEDLTVHRYFLEEVAGIM